MDDFLLNIAGLSSENLTSEILRYILTNESYEVYQRVFYNYIFGNNLNKSTSELGIDLTQERYDLGTPDIVIKKQEEVFF